jgi:hypothetical protein
MESHKLNTENVQLIEKIKEGNLYVKEADLLIEKSKEAFT